MYETTPAGSQGSKHLKPGADPQADPRLQPDLLAHAYDAVLVHDLHGRVLCCNPAACSLYGWTAQEAANRNADELLRTRYPVPFESIRAALNTGGFWEGELVQFRADGTAVAVQSRWVVQRDARGEPERVLRIERDITEQRRAQNAERMLDAVMEYIPEGITIADAPDVSIRRVSRFGQRLTGRDRRALEGIPVEQHAARWAIFEKDGVTPGRNEDLPLTRATQHGEVVTDEEWVLQRPSGEKVSILCNAGPIRDEQGAIAGGVIAWRDITQRRRLEERLHVLASARCLLWHAEVMEGGDGWLRWSFHFPSEEATQRFLPVERKRGQSFEEAWYDAREPADRERADQTGMQAIREGRDYTQEYRCRLADGSIRWVCEDVQVEVVEPGRSWRAVGVCTDVTERKRAEEDARQAQQRLHLALSRGSMGAWEWDVARDHITWSPENAALFGLRAEDHDGTTRFWTERVHPDDLPGYVAQLDGVLSRREEVFVSSEFRVKHADGTWRWHQTMAHVSYDADGCPAFLTGIGMDITERRQAQERIRQLNEDLTRRNAELDAERARWQQVVEGIADEIWLADAEGRMSLINLPDVTHMGLEEFEDRTYEQVLEELQILNTDGQPRPPEQAPLLRSLRGETVRGEEIMRHAATGRTCWREFSSVPIRDAAGAMVGAVAVVRDVTEHKRMQEALRASEEQLRVATLAAEIGVWSWEPGTSQVVVSANWRQLFGVAPDAAVTFETWRDALHPDDRERAVQQLNEASQQHRDFDTEYRIVRPDGTVRWVVDRGRATYDESGRAVGMAGVNVDITARKQAEEALRERVAEIETLMEAAPVAIWIAHDRQCSHITGNRVGAALLRSQPGRNLSFTAPVEERPAVIAQRNGEPVTGEQLPMQYAAAHGVTVRDAELEIAFPDGSVRHILGNASPLYDAHGQVRGSVGTFLDVTERKQRENEIAELNERLQRAMSETHHRVKNNLQVVSALLEMQMFKAERTVPAKELGRIRSHIQALAAIHDLLTHAAKASGQAECVHTQAAFGKLLPVLQGMMGERQLECQIEDLCVPVRQGTALAVLVNELVSNAIKHGRGAVEVSLMVEGETARLEVSDEGPGFPAGFDAVTAANTGLELVLMLSRWDLRGDAQFGKGAHGGAAVRVTFPVAAQANSAA